MGRIEYLLGIFFLLGTQTFPDNAPADTFGSGANSFEIEFVTIGDPGNPPDANPNPAGAVSYEYRIGKYEVSEQMIDKANALGGLGITKDTRGLDKPATSVTWYEAARFANWLNTSKGHTPAYKFDVGGNFKLWEPSDPGYDPMNLYRNRLAFYFLPTQHEWHKAAYYDPASGSYYSFPTGSNDPPIPITSGTDPGTAVYMQTPSTGPADIKHAGGLNPYGTMAQGGNVIEWHETALDWQNTETGEGRQILGGAWSSFEGSMRASNTGGGLIPSAQSNGIGFRIAANVPEPMTAALVVAGVLGFYALRTCRPVRR